MKQPTSHAKDPEAAAPLPDRRLPAIAAFAALAAGYCEWCERPRKGRDANKAAIQWLSRLNEGVLNLPKIPNREELPLAPRWHEIPDLRGDKHAHLGMFDWHYRKVFDPDPKGTDAPLLGWALDDLADVYRDLSGGLALYENGYPLNACHHWRMTYANHWGMHATGALVAIFFKHTKMRTQF
jgi:hypothetical protein